LSEATNPGTEPEMAQEHDKLVIVGMSGGVDSSVAAGLLLERGYRVEGLFMRNWDEDDTWCTAAEDFQDARRVCEELAIPLHRANFAADYRQRVFADFLAACRAGHTPNPDVLCNREIKFGVFHRHALRLGADLVATGHYARRTDGAHGCGLHKGVDPAKDQSYFLHAIAPGALARSCFPLGGMHKPEVRRLARAWGFVNHAKKDSTGICFIGQRNFRDFLGRYLPAQPGEMRTPEGEVVGHHAGLMFYTLGQRQGLGIGGRPGADDRPWYVLDKDLGRNVLIVGQGHDHPLLYHDVVEVSAMRWLTPHPPALPARCHARLRYRQADQACRVEDAGSGRVRLRFERPQRAVTPGQSAVLYRGTECLGGGVIEMRARTARELAHGVAEAGG